MASEISKVDRDELLKRIEDENLFDKSFASEYSASSKVRTMTEQPSRKEEKKSESSSTTGGPAGAGKPASSTSKRTQIYKPDLSMSTSQQPTKLLALPSTERSEAMDNIARQIEAFHKLKSEVEDDLEGFVEELVAKKDTEGKALYALPANFDEIVELQTEELMCQQENEEEDILDENG